MWFERVLRATSIPALLVAGLVSIWAALPAAAQSLLRDADIEHALSKLAAPVLQSAGLSPRSVKILLVNDDSFNAFVVDHRAIFLNYGLVLKVTDAAMLQAVIAHEAAHIQNGHIARRIENFRSSRTSTGLGIALAIIAAAAGAGEAAGGIAAGTQSASLRSFLSHTRAEEASADRSAASYMLYAGIDPRALVRLHDALASEELLTSSGQDPYTRSHPLSSDRARAARAFVEANVKGTIPANPDTEYWFHRMRGKVSAFTRPTKWTMRRVEAETYSDVKLMREAVAYHRDNNTSASIARINSALEQRPDDAYYLELKGQILMENRRWAEAQAAYEAAIAIDGSNALILAGYGKALLANGQPKAAVEVMERARARDARNTRLLRDMSLAYAKTGQTGKAALVTAERYALSGRAADARTHAKRAVALLPRGSTAWRRAEDILIATERLEQGKRKR